ncbi:MAG: leucine-rich repeat protein [Ruminococcus sp.]|nr:leucine-rich repeat protein [Ruminococcus sp.]
MMKRLFCVISAALTMLASVPSVTAGESTSASFTYTVTGTAAAITGVTGAGTTLDIPAEIDGYTVTSIASQAFFGQDKLETVKLPETLVSIGDSAFAGCLSLTDIDLPDSVTTLGKSCFISCSALKTAELSSALTAIPEKCFYSCTSLSSVEIPSSVTSVGAEAFFSCTDLLSLTVPSTVTDIGTNAVGMQYNIRTGVSGVQGFVLTCEWDSAAQTYAEQNGLTYSIFVSFLKGDVNSDGLVDPADASLILVFNANIADNAPSIFNEQQMLAADYNGDGLIDSADASLILYDNANSA